MGQTVKFLPAHCMMGKVHSGVIVSLEDQTTRIDCIDLKIWEHTKGLSGINMFLIPAFIIFVS